MRRFIALSLMLFLLTGCISQQLNTDIQPDGSGTHVIQIGFSRQFLDFAQMGSQSSVDIEDLMGEFTRDVDLLPEEWEATSDTWRSADNQYEGSQVSLRFADFAMLEEQLLSDELAEINALVIFSDVAIRRENDELIINATLENNEASSSFGNPDELSGLGALGSAPNALWTLKLPGKIVSWTNQEHGTLDPESNTVSYKWNYPLTEPQTIEIRSSLKVATTQSWLVVGSLVGASVVLLLTGFWLIRRQRKTPVVAIPTSPMPYYQPPAAPPVQPYQPRPNTFTPNDAPTYPNTPPVQPYQPHSNTFKPSDSPAGYDEPTVMPTRALGSWLTDEKDRN